VRSLRESLRATYSLAIAALIVLLTAIVTQQYKHKQMNSDASCHKVPNCPGLFVDAFFGCFLKQMAKPCAAFTLMHYHRDHYKSLLQDGKYTGPALIHGTPITAALLRMDQQVPDECIVEHVYGETWWFGPEQSSMIQSTEREKLNDKQVGVMFYDANHCPGAAIVVIKLPSGLVHVHTGDLCCHDCMQQYAVMREAALSKRVNTLFQTQHMGLTSMALYHRMMQSIIMQVLYKRCCIIKQEK
jgi:DNA cross-link repair 1A protein